MDIELFDRQLIFEKELIAQRNSEIILNLPAIYDWYRVDASGSSKDANYKSQRAPRFYCGSRTDSIENFFQSIEVLSLPPIQYLEEIISENKNEIERISINFQNESQFKHKFDNCQQNILKNYFNEQRKLIEILEINY